jgi:hypothetical protein
MARLAVVRRYRWRHEAEVDQGLLEDAGIGAVVQADDAGGALSGIGGLPPGELPVRLMVLEEDLQIAREVLPDETES